jgi:hypothetical protein
VLGYIGTKSLYILGLKNSVFIENPSILLEFDDNNISYYLKEKYYLPKVEFKFL